MFTSNYNFSQKLIRYRDNMVKRTKTRHAGAILNALQMDVPAALFLYFHPITPKSISYVIKFS